MSHLKANSIVIKQALRGTRARYALQGHDGLQLHTRGDGNGSWRLRYRAAGKRQWHTLHNDARNAVLADVIEAKDRWLSRIKLDGGDPKQDLAKAKVAAVTAARTFAVAFGEWIAHTGKRRKRTLSKRTDEEYRRIYKLHIEPHFGTKLITEISRADIEAALTKVRKATTDTKKGHRGTQALKALKIIRPIFERELDSSHIVQSPCRGIEDPVPRDNPAGKASRPLSNDELRILWTEAPHGMSAATVRVLRLTILLGRRISEIAGARRDDARLGQSQPVLFIPADREGNKAKRDDAVPLPGFALTIVKEALEAGMPGDPLFKGAATRWTTSHAFKDFRRNKEWSGKTRLHDARSLINDQMAAMGVPTEIRSRVLHHTGDLRQLANTVYSAYDFVPERLRALELWEGRLHEIVSGVKPSGLRW